ncbi:MAG: carboxylating nicotinate-nucleotide diphosphorylase [Gaiellales bacterium]|nr:MAG: carboxylating nicotinate-nucleotide diphosphorylase [Gaiellales bacterium]
MNQQAGEPGKVELERIVSLALAEDLGAAGDITSKAIFSESASGAARVVTREPCTVSGMAAAAEVCRQVGGLDLLPLVQDGQAVPAAAEVIHLDGSLRALLSCERTLLNFLSRLSGIATLTRSFVDAVAGTGATVAATRKTGPGMRRLEKEAVVHGGGVAHRAGLYDAALIKDNHIAAAGGLAPAVDAVIRELGGEVEIEVEVDTIGQLAEAAEAAVDWIMLDNMRVEEVRECVALVAGRKKLEASGGIGLDNIREYALAGVERISVGELTRSAPGIDFSMEVDQ